MKLISNLAHIDKQAIEGLGIPGLLLMEEAGRQVAERVKNRFEACLPLIQKVVILCGAGNNGGDGFVCARKLTLLSSKLTERASITVIHTASAEKYTGDAKINLDLLAHYPVRVIHASTDNFDRVNECLASAGILVDALFGSGLSRPIEPESLEARLINGVSSLNSGPYVIAVDLPSGVSSETGQLLGTALQAHQTVTFATGKPGLYLPPGKYKSGQVVVVDIGIPQSLIEGDLSAFRLTTQESVARCLPKRKLDAHKYSVGCVMVVAGSQSMPGAAQLTAEAALSAGAGLVVLASPESVFQQLQLRPEIVHLSLPETAEGSLSSESIDVVLQGIEDKKCRAIAIGPGLGQGEETQQAVKTLLNRLKPWALPVVIDADGLNALVSLEEGQISSLYSGNQTVLTPHVGEGARLLKCSAQKVESNLLGSAHEIQARWGCHVVLKSSVMVTARWDDEKTLWLNSTGNSGMATAGSGDVLTGIIASLAAQGQPPGEAAVCGAYIHGLAGDLAAEALSSQAMKAGDITESLPSTFQALLSLE